jgi:hypothetical protein
MAQRRHDMAERLLEAQVRFLEAQLEAGQFGSLLERELDHLLSAAAQITLAEAVTREQIKAVAIKYALAMKIPGSIPELANEIADRIYSHPAQDDTRLEDAVAAPGAGATDREPADDRDRLRMALPDCQRDLSPQP